MKINKKKVKKEAFIKWLKKDRNQKRKFRVADDGACPMAAFLLDTFPKAKYVSMAGGMFAICEEGEEKIKNFIKAPSWVDKFVSTFDLVFADKEKVSGKSILKELGL